MIDGQSCAGRFANVSTLNSLTKFYAIPGLRLGYGVFPLAVKARLDAQILPWSVNSLAQAFGRQALADQAYQKLSRECCRDLRNDLYTQLAQIPELQVFPGAANYLLVKLIKGRALSLSEYCARQGILIRLCSNYQGFDSPESFFRIAIRTQKENQQILAAIQDYCAGNPKPGGGRKKTPALMFQGTCSDAGKSILTAALCRILYQDGVDVVPFKAQNMSLNSYVTQTGSEMGRAQVVQAQAAGMAPDHRMNPVLLKPNSDTGSQVIVNGQPVGNMTVVDYSIYKNELWPKVKAAYDSLAAEHQVVILEGAGSPGEVNLKKEDIVNMRMAAHADAPVLLVGDIDRGGVYASFVGVMEVLEQWERSLVSGFVVNKFRGQASLLESAHDYVFLHTGRRVLGVVPYLSNLGLPEEDSVSFKKGSFNQQRAGDQVELALVNLPHISNFTDVEPFLQEPDVAVRVVERAEELESPDCIILPGSKNVIQDLKFLKDNGFAAAITRYAEQGGEVIGICGGYQMLGRRITDPYGIESGLGEIRGLGLLPIETVIEKNKQLTRKRGTHLPTGHSVIGYEIHHGVTVGGTTSLLTFSDGSSCGSYAEVGTIWGSYLHGIFDADHFRRWFIDGLRQKRGLAKLGEIQVCYDLEEGFSRLADTVRQALDMKAISRLLGI
jgi:cobyric acid synthase CobQ